MSIPDFSIKLEIPPVETETIVLDVRAVFDPIKELEDLIKNEEWFKGIVHSTVLFEVLGRWILQARFKEKIKPQRFEHFRLEQIIMFLFASHLIDYPTYTRMMGVKGARNKLVHQLWEGLTLDPKQARTTIKRAIRCLKALGFNE